jgi:hypothetical protein
LSRPLVHGFTAPSYSCTGGIKVVYGGSCVKLWLGLACVTAPRPRKRKERRAAKKKKATMHIYRAVDRVAIREHCVRSLISCLVSMDLKLPLEMLRCLVVQRRGMVRAVRLKDDLLREQRAEDAVLVPSSSFGGARIDVLGAVRTLAHKSAVVGMASADNYRQPSWPVPRAQPEPITPELCQRSPTGNASSASVRLDTTRPPLTQLSPQGALVSPSPAVAPISSPNSIARSVLSLRVRAGPAVRVARPGGISVACFAATLQPMRS